MPAALAPDAVARVASEVFGYDELRPGQRQAVESVLGGRDTLVVVATGAGKSAIYAIAGQLAQGPTIIVSPLIALQRDQLLGLEQARGVQAVAVNSSASAAQRDQALAAIDTGAADYVFLAPEQLAHPELLERLRAAGPGLVAVDEAHLVSQWGQDFRPDYLRIASAVEALGRPPILALTATAAPPVREDIVERLGMRDAAVLVRGFDRPNIALGVQSSFATDVDKLEALRRDVVDAVRHTGRGIVYVGTRKGAEGLVADWNERGVRAAAYHAGLKRAVRVEVERAFHADEVEVVVATVAFGMGVDKPDIRWVFHADISPSLDAYYQEIGRAGRDGLPAEAVLYYRPDDLRIPKMYAAGSGPSAATLATVAAAVPEEGATTVAEVARTAGVTRARASAALFALRDAGGVHIGTHGTVRAEGDVRRAIEGAIATGDRQRAMERSRLETMAAYAETLGCRRAFLLEYFGERAEPACGNCDNDERAAARDEEVDSGPRPFPRRSRVRHPTFGDGEVVGYAGSRILVTFDEAGYKRLDVALVLAGDLLERLS